MVCLHLFVRQAVVLEQFSNMPKALEGLIEDRQDIEFDKYEGLASTIDASLVTLWIKQYYPPIQ